MTVSRESNQWIKDKLTISWENATREGAELFQLRYGASLTFLQKLQWLEDMTTLAARFQKNKS